MRLGEAEPGSLAFFSVLSANGISNPTLVGSITRLDQTGFYELTTAVPAGLAGSTFELQGFAYETGRWIDSAVETLRIQ
jgi:hypothetical protein